MPPEAWKARASTSVVEAADVSIRLSSSPPPSLTQTRTVDVRGEQPAGVVHGQRLQQHDLGQWVGARREVVDDVDDIWRP